VSESSVNNGALPQEAVAERNRSALSYCGAWDNHYQSRLHHKHSLRCIEVRLQETNGNGEILGNPRWLLPVGSACGHSNSTSLSYINRDIGNIYARSRVSSLR
jgi:hypothetical protein